MLCQLPLFNDSYAVYCTRGESTKGAKQLGGGESEATSGVKRLVGTKRLVGMKRHGAKRQGEEMVHND